jgi:BirA family transcriptional regulator, biotin operon repressor / biotin---[acetyl-CoA-carboxylase] ligase
MKTIFLGRNCIELEQTDSTSNYLTRLLTSYLQSSIAGRAGGEPLFEGTLVIAKHQKQGRGQRGAAWESEAGKNLIFSFFLRPIFLKIGDQFQLNKAISLGVMEFLQVHLFPLEGRKEGEGTLHSDQGNGRDVRVSVKWPNDIYIDNKKIAGILIENSVSGNELRHSIVGIGININQQKFPIELPNPTSLKLVTGKEFELRECLEEICSCIERRYLQLRNVNCLQGASAKGRQNINTDYLESLYRFNEWTNYKYRGGIINAKITGVSQVGKLILKTHTGEVVECDFKEVGFTSILV